MIVDYHMHLRNECSEIAHAVGAIEPFVETASTQGVDEIGFTEHVYYFEQTRTLWRLPDQTERCVYDIVPCVDAVVAAKERGWPVKLGLEVDYVSGREDAHSPADVGRDFDRARELLRAAVFEQRRARQDQIG